MTDPDSNSPLHDMEEGEIQTIEVSDNSDFEVIAVPNGWLWTRREVRNDNGDHSFHVTTTFVPRPFGK